MKRLAALAAAGFLAAAALLAQPDARTIRLTLTEGTSMAAALSPDGRTIAIDLLGTLWTMPAQGGAATRITDDSLDARQPVWSPDGRRIAFQAYRSGTWNIWTIGADGRDLAPLTWGPYDDREPHWSPDGARIAFSSDRSGNYDIWTLTLASGELKPITSNPANDSMPAWSPDGAEIAYVSDRRDRAGVWAIKNGVERLVTASGGAVAGPSWSPDGSRVAFNVIADGRSRLVVGDRDVSIDEDVFPFRPQWISPADLLYTADGKIKRRAVGGGAPQIVRFTAEVSFTRAPFTPRRREFPAAAVQPVRGIMHPAISPDGTRVAFAALGDLWLMPIGSAPQRITNDPFIETEPAWSPDGRSLLFASDRAGSMDLWVRDVPSGAERRLTDLPGAEMYGSWSPDGARVAFVNANGELFVAETKSLRESFYDPRKTTPGVISQKVHERLFDPGRPAWTPDGRALVVAALKPYSTRFREGTNQLLWISLDGQPDRWIPLPHRSMGSRESYSARWWSPDGSRQAVVIDGVLQVLPVGRDGQPLGPPRQLSLELAFWPTWTADSRRLLYLTDDGLKLVTLDDGRTQTIPVTLTWTPKVTRSRVVVHARRLFDGRANTLREDIDLLIEGNRIRSVEAHRSNLHTGTVVDAGSETVMPGLIEMHSHQSKGYGEALGRIWLSFGVTTVRNPAANPFEGIEDREAVESGARIGPRIFTTGDPFDGSRIYYAGGTSLDGPAQLDRQLERAARLGFDLIKTYVRLSDPLQKRVIEFAHAHGMPVTSHELYPAVAYGADGVEHIRGTSRRGYSPKVTALNRSYGDVVDLLTASKMTITPTIGIQGGFQLLTLGDSSWVDDPRIQRLYPPSVAQSGRVTERPTADALAARAAAMRPLGELVARVVKGGGRVVAGTDAPIIPYGLSLLTELEHYVEGGLSPYEALRTATVVSADALGMAADLGAIENGKLADLVFVEGNPLANIRDLRRVRRVMKDGELFDLAMLLAGPARPASGSTGSRD